MLWTYDLFFFSFLCACRLKHFLLQYIFRKLCWSCGRKRLQFFVRNALYFCYILMEVEICGQFLVQLSSIKFHQNLPVGSPVVTCRQTDRHDEANRHIIFATFLYERSEWSRNTLAVCVILPNLLVLCLPKAVQPLLLHTVIWHLYCCQIPHSRFRTVHPTPPPNPKPRNGTLTIEDKGASRIWLWDRTNIRLTFDRTSFQFCCRQWQFCSLASSSKQLVCLTA